MQATTINVLTRLFLLLLATQNALCRDTKMLVVLAGNGARYPGTVDKEGEYRRGEVSENGLRMSYLLGKYLRQQYDKSLLPQRFNFNENWVLASGAANAQMSAQALMLGVYDFGSLSEPLKVDARYYKPEWKDFDIQIDFQSPLPKGFQPVPVHSFQPGENFAFTPFDWNLCPLMKAYTLQNSGDQGQKILNYANAVLDELRKEGFNPEQILGKKERLTEVREFDRVADYITANKYVGKDFGISDALYNKIVVVQSMQANYVYFKDPQVSSYMFTELGKIIVDKLSETQASIAKDDKSYSKFILLEGNDINIFNMLSLAKLTSFECLEQLYQGKQADHCYLIPPYASSVIFEMYSENKELYMDVIYNGESVNFCGANGNEKCKFNVFADKFKSILQTGETTDLRKIYCYEKPIPKNKMMTAILGFNVVVIGVLVLLILKYKKKLNEYA